MSVKPLFRIIAFTGWVIAGCLIAPQAAPAQEAAVGAASAQQAAVGAASAQQAAVGAASAQQAAVGAASAQQAAVGAASVSRPIPYKSVVESVSPDQKSVRIGKLKTRNLKITDATRILRNDGTATTVEELHPGADIRGAYRKLANGELEAITIRLGTKPNPPM